ncbi:hypothetical protein [Pseudomonas aeruginosa]|uniref:hypothetical protein n=1 Tax=Pseudomonas aeruginosa TaxID=287 RepID=UPI003D2BDBCB
MSKMKEPSDFLSRPPVLYFREDTCDEAWETLLGSREAMNAIWREVVESGIKINGRAKGALKAIPRGALLSLVILDPGVFRAFAEKVGSKRASNIRDQVNIQKQMARLLTEEAYKAILQDIAGAQADHLLDMVDEALPEIGEICDAGGFSREIVTSAILISTLLNMDEELSTGKNVYIVDMALHLLLMAIPQPIIREAVISCYERLGEVYGGRIIDSITDPLQLDPQSPLFESEPEVAAYYLADTISRCARQRLMGTEDFTDYYLETIQGFMLASRSDSYLVIHTLSTLLGRAKSDWQLALATLSDIDLNPGAQIRLENLSKIVLPDEFEHVDQEVLSEARIFLASLRNDVEAGIFEEIDDTASEIEAVHRQLATLLMEKGDFKDIGSLSQKGEELSKKLPPMIDEALDSMERFRASVVRFSVALARSKARADDKPEPPVVVQPDVAPADIPAAEPEPAIAPAAEADNSRSELELELLNTNDLLEKDLRDSRADVFRLNQLVEALQKRPDQPLGCADEDLAALSCRIARGRRLSPEEVLRFYSYTAKDRVEILDSAWKSARNAEHFAQPDKLIEMLGRLFFDYLDEVRKGEPMGKVGREMFSNGFAARESQTVQVTTQMRAQREFVYQGAPRFFEYRLRVGNGWGPVESMRVYFDVLDNRVVVAYVGPHLEQAGTN